MGLDTPTPDGGRCPLTEIIIENNHNGHDIIFLNLGQN